MSPRITLGNVLLLCSLSLAHPTISTFASDPAVNASALEARYTTWNGIATYFYQNNAAGSCGQTHSDSYKLVAISEQSPFTYNAHCGQTVTITNMGGGQNNYGKGNTVTALVADTCPSCANSHLGTCLETRCDVR